jgi:hypothetical protein
MTEECLAKKQKASQRENAEGKIKEAELASPKRARSLRKV